MTPNAIDYLSPDLVKVVFPPLLALITGLVVWYNTHITLKMKKDITRIAHQTNDYLTKLEEQLTITRSLLSSALEEIRSQDRTRTELALKTAGKSQSEVEGG